MTYVADSAKVPEGLINVLDWPEVDWTEKTKKWTGYNDKGVTFPEGTVLLTFTCKVNAAGSHKMGLKDLLPFDSEFIDVIPSLTVGRVVGKEVVCDHTFGPYVSNNDATCTADGTKSATCTACGFEKTEADKGSALGHTFGGYYSDKNATCTSDGTKTATCRLCGVADTIDDLGTILPHADNDKDKFCDGCGMKMGGAFLNVTVTPSASKVSVGGTVTYTVTATGHDISCLEFTLNPPEGMTYVADSAKVPEGLADLLGWPAVDWTEKTKKWTGYNDIGVEFPEGIVLLTFSCKIEAEGNYRMGLKDLLPFDSEFVDVIPSLSVGRVTGTVGPCSHYFGEYVPNGDATCTADGTKTALCTYCGETDTKADAGSALGHSFTKYTSNGDATCTTDGTKTAKCDRCDETDTKADPGSA
jgi:hypothetical protein